MGAPDPTLSSLHLSFQQLVRLMRHVGHGRIRRLSIRDGLPVFDPPPTMVRTLRVDRPAKQSALSTDFALRKRVMDLVAMVKMVRRGVIERLEVVDGLPTLVELAEPAEPARSTSTRAWAN